MLRRMHKRYAHRWWSMCLFITLVLATACGNAAPAPSRTLPPQITYDTYGSLALGAGGVAGCPSFFHANELMEIQGHGYQPGSTVIVALTAKRRTSAARINLLHVLANSRGNITAKVRVPQDFTGLTTTGQSASFSAGGLAFIEAIGVDTHGRSLDNIAMFTLVPVGAPCPTPTPIAFTIVAVVPSQISVGQTYAGDLQAVGGVAPYSWSVIHGALPSGLVLNKVEGTIIGRTTTAGTSTFTVEVTDSSRPPQVAKQTLSITSKT